MKQKKGQKLFEYDILLSEIRLAKYKEPATISFEKAAKGETAPHRKVLMEENHIYIAALNFQNAIKQVRKMYPYANPKIIK